VSVFKERLHEAMFKSKINQSELAELAKVSKASISQYLSGKNEPRYPVIVKFAEALGVDEAWLDGHSDEPLTIKPRILRPHQAAKIMGTNPDSIRIRMQKERFNPSIGTACNLNGNRYSYEIYPERLAAYLNITVDAVFQRLNA
jgi:transcriptional regulator with XRE-family HTH domain